MDNKQINNISKILVIITFVLFIVHIFNLGILLIDNTTLMLIGLLVLALLFPIIKKVTYGPLSMELTEEVKDARKKVDNIHELEDIELEDEFRDIPKEIAAEINSVLKYDSVLALARVRIELEDILKKLIIKKTNSKEINLDMKETIKILEKNKLIDKSYISAIKDVSAICNRAMHEKEVTEKIAKEIVDLGLELIEKLYNDWLTLVIKPKSKKNITDKKREEYMNARYEITTVVPILDKPYMNKYLLTQDELDEFMIDYETYAEFIVEIKKID